VLAQQTIQQMFSTTREPSRKPILEPYIGLRRDSVPYVTSCSPMVIICCNRRLSNQVPLVRCW
jgi:hypothetical protein